MNSSQIDNCKVGIVMGSKSDLTIMQEAASILAQLDISFELITISAYRNSDQLFEYAKTAAQRGLKVMIVGSGSGANLSGVLAALTHLPVIGVPIKSQNSVDGWDSIVSILQMPNGVPVATVALNAGKNGGILAAQILSTADDELCSRLIVYKNLLRDQLDETARDIDISA